MASVTESFLVGKYVICNRGYVEWKVEGEGEWKCEES